MSAWHLFSTAGELSPQGLACELVVPPEWLNEISADALKSQFARTPYRLASVVRKLPLFWLPYILTMEIVPVIESPS